MASIGSFGVRVKQYLKQWLPEARIEREARRCGHRWRKTKLGPGRTVQLLLVQLLAFNTALSAVRHLGAVAVTASALCQARARLPLELLRRCASLLVDRFNAQQDPGGGARWCGREVVAADAVFYYAPDTAELRQWLGSKNAFGYPLMKVLSLFCLSSGMMLHQIPFSWRRGEAPLLGRLLRWIRPMSVLVMDRAFASYANLCRMMHQQVDGVIRLNSRLWASSSSSSSSGGGGGSRRRRVRRLGKRDYLVRWERPAKRCALLSRLRWNALPQELTLRQVSFAVQQRGYRSRSITVITTLLDPQLYPASKIAELYGRRWEIEIQFRHLKQTLNWEFMRCKSITGVKKELLLRQIAYNLLRAIMSRQAQSRSTRLDRISFIDALRWLLYCPLNLESMPLLLVPDRPGRLEPRRRKRQDKNYLPLNCPRAEARRKAA